MLIPKDFRKQLRSIGHPYWFWYPIVDWAYGERYRFRDGVVAYLFDGEIVTLRKGITVVWRQDPASQVGGV